MKNNSSHRNVRNWSFDNDSEYDTGVLPPGNDVGEPLKNRGQSLNRGFGASQADMARGYVSTPQPPIYERPHPQRQPYFTEKGFLNRSPVSDER